MKVSSKHLANLCPVQAALLKEKVILVDKNDQIVGSETKENAHLISNILGKGVLHRAFSVFLFNTKNELLLQQRSSEKITFPNLWTNTCCSHPLYTIEEERDPVIGTRIAAVRRMQDELGISDIKNEDITFMTKIIYYGASNGEWGEHELDHVLLVKKDVPTKPNPNEVRAVKYVSREELYRLLDSDDKQFKVTPWFKIICNSFLKKWWDNIDNLENVVDDTVNFFNEPPKQ